MENGKMVFGGSHVGRCGGSGAWLLLWFFFAAQSITIATFCLDTSLIALALVGSFRSADLSSPSDLFTFGAETATIFTSFPFRPRQFLLKKHSKHRNLQVFCLLGEGFSFTMVCSYNNVRWNCNGFFKNSKILNYCFFELKISYISLGENLIASNYFSCHE